MDKNYPNILNDYLVYLSTIKGRSPTTVDEYGYDVARFFRYLSVDDLNTIDDLDNVNIKDFDIDLLKKIEITDIHSYLTFLGKEKRNSVNTRARKIASLRSFFKYICNIRKIIDTNPTELLESPTRKIRNPIYLTLEECLLLLNTVEQTKNEIIRKRDYAIITIFLNCGLRLSELTNIDVDNIKVDKLEIIGKGNKQRIIYLNESCIDAIDNYLSVRPIVNDRALFLSNRNKRMSNRAVQHRIDYYLKEAGFDTTVYSTHKLRHTAATLMYKYGGVDMKILQEILGHESISTTQIYTHINDVELRTAFKHNPLNKLHNSKKNEE